MPEQPAKGESKITSISKNKFLTLIIGVTVILVLIGAGWYYFSQSSTERDAEKKLEAETGGKVNIEGDKVTIETDQGTVTTSKTQAPENFPSDVSIYKGAEITGSTDAVDGVTLMLSTSDSVSQVSKFYQGDVKAKGWKISANSSLEGSALLTAEKDKRSLLITISPDKSTGKTSIAIVASK